MPVPWPEERCYRHRAESQHLHIRERQGGRDPVRAISNSARLCPWQQSDGAELTPITVIPNPCSYYTISSWPSDQSPRAGLERGRQGGVPRDHGHVRVQQH